YRKRASAAVVVPAQVSSRASGDEGIRRGVDAGACCHGTPNGNQPDARTNSKGQNANLNCSHAVYFVKYIDSVRSKARNRVVNSRRAHLDSDTIETAPVLSGLLMRTLIIAVLAAADYAGAQAVIVSVTPDADSFIRSAAPASNYGGAGALSVSGSAAVNSSSQQNGLFDALIRFPTSNVVSSLNQAFGSSDWLVTGFRLLVTEMAAPDNAMFNRGVGGFEIRWLAADDWLEGTGKPMAPTNNGVAWQDLPTILNSNLDTSL